MRRGAARALALPAYRHVLEEQELCSCPGVVFGLFTAGLSMTRNERFERVRIFHRKSALSARFPSTYPKPSSSLPSLATQPLW